MSYFITFVAVCYAAWLLGKWEDDMDARAKERKNRETFHSPFGD